MRNIGQYLFSVLVMAAVWGAMPMARAQESAPSLLERAWREYRFQSYRTAAKLFKEAYQRAGDTTEGKQARLGLGLVAQFDEVHPDPARAERIYRELLDDNSDIGLMAQSMLAELLAREGQLDEANALWKAVIKKSPANIIAQDALMNETLANMGENESKETLEAIEEMQKARQEIPSYKPEAPTLDPVYDELLGSVYFWRGDYRKARSAMIRSADNSSKLTTGYSKRATKYIKIARISENLLNDPKTAGLYYKRILIETPNDVRSYYALEKAVQLGAITREEVAGLSLNGVDQELIDELFAKKD